MDTATIEAAYQLAKDLYAEYGVDVDRALQRLRPIAGSMYFSEGEEGDKSVGACKQHPVVQMLVDPAADGPADLGEIEHHPSPVQLRCLDGNQHPAVVSVQVLGLALVAQEPVAVAEVDLA